MFAVSAVCSRYLRYVRGIRGMFAVSAVCSRYPRYVRGIRGMFAVSAVCSRYPRYVRGICGMFAVSAVCSRCPRYVRGVRGMFAVSAVCSRYPRYVCGICGMFAVCSRYPRYVRGIRGMFAVSAVSAVCSRYPRYVRGIRGMFAVSAVCSRYLRYVRGIRGMFAVSAVCSRYPRYVRGIRGMFAVSAVCSRYPRYVRDIRGMFAVSAVCSRYPQYVCGIRGMIAVSADVNDSAETSKLNMVRSRSVPFRAEYAGFKTVRSPPSLESPTTEDSVQNLQRLAFKHKMKVVKDAACRKPMPKVIKVSDVYPSATKIYLPQCTIIHQCAEDTGCCSGPFEKCGPKSSEKVDLYFYAYSTSSIVRGASPHQIEKLGFYNHTECECHEDMPRDDSNVMENETKSVTESPPALEEPCFCPTDYTVRRFLNGSCGCDCFDKDRNCLRFKKGKEYLSLKDKWCIKTNKCHTPSCEYGKYSAKVGRCPRQNEKSRFF
ncbi:hypothetical protein M8J77_025922 [Diaphorina citri]|nr:hypothetical protein M8J77_025922 [Diaphorina citri]